MRSESLYVPPKISDSLILKTTRRIHKGGLNFDHSINLKERGMSRSLIAAGLIEQARDLI